MAGKLAKFKGGLARAKNYAKQAAKAESVGSVGHEIVTAGSHALLALASKSVSSVGPIPLKPDMAGLIAGGLTMMFAKGKTRKLGRSVTKGAVHALITRGINDGAFPTFGPVQGPSERE